MPASDNVAAVRDVARIVSNAGGRALLVGGAVRDEALGIPGAAKDADIEVFGLSPDRLKAVLGEHYDLDLVGLSFGVLKLKHLDVDVSLPRRESKRGRGHKGFDIDSDPSLTVAEAASRRDFTVNAIYRDPITGEIEDPFNGLGDLRTRILRHVSPKFSEDPLRVMRGMQFVARFDLSPAPETIAICRSMSMEGLPPERLFDEWKKFLLKGVAMTKGLGFLRAVGWTSYFPELAALIGCRQDPQWHPEGDVWNHTCCCLDAFAKRRDGTADDLTVGLAVLCHDFGKPATTRFDRVKGRLRSLGHDTAGVKPALQFLERLTNEERILREVPPLVAHHMEPFMLWRAHAGDSAIRKLALKTGSIARLVRVAMADDEGRPPIPPDPEATDWLLAEAARLAVKDAVPKPLVQGRDLISFGLKPSPQFGRILKCCYEAQLDGKFSDVDSGRAWLGAWLSNKGWLPNGGDIAFLAHAAAERGIIGASGEKR